MQQSITIQKNPSLTDSSNYELLRKKGLEYIEQLGSAIWTDYNIHDPGITILELLSYAITDLGYRSSLDIKDLIAAHPADHNKPSPLLQAFFPAADVLTVNPWSINDYRKILIDIDGVKNAWLRCKETACNDMVLYAKCADSKLQYENEMDTHPVLLKGFYDIQLEFDNEDSAGDLNSGKVRYNFSFPIEDGIDTAMIEMRLPSWQQVQQQPGRFKDFATQKNIGVNGVNVGMIIDGDNATAEVQQSKLANKIRSTLYAATIEVEYQLDADSPSENFIELVNVPFRVWFNSDSSRRQVQLTQIKKAIEDNSASGIFAKYLALLKRAEQVMDDAKNSLHNCRNLCEDFCSVAPVQVQDFSVCGDIEVKPEADIEAVLAEVYYRIDQYLSPDIKFYSLKELMNNGVAVDEIFEGPRLYNGFINNTELTSANLKEYVYGSDIINLLMDIPGVISIKNFMLSQYNTLGNITASHAWVLHVDENCQPRFYPEASKILVFKNNLPFLPDRTELTDTLQVIKGKYAQPKYSMAENDLPVPEGKYYQLNDYYPLQYSLPDTYGVGYAGIADAASAERKAQVKQLKAYLMFFEQLLVNYLKQLSNVKELFAVEDNDNTTYFRHLLTENDIKGADQLFNGLDENNLKQLFETDEERLDRRNRFLDHLMARFAESFTNYALMLYSFSSGRAVAQDKLVRDKVSFLKQFTTMSHNRAKAFNYKKPLDYTDAADVQTGNNVAGLHLRIQRLLGMDGFGGIFEMFEVKDNSGNITEKKWRFKDTNGKVYLVSQSDFKNDSNVEGERKAREQAFIAKKFIQNTTRYQNSGAGFVIELTDEANNVIASNLKSFSSKADSDAAIADIISFGLKLNAADKVFVVEHLLLRPKYAAVFGLPAGVTESDPLLPICIPPTCDFCEGETDPYSFRLTVVLSGETGIAAGGMEFRRFAEETIRKEVPAHLGVKICWVSNEQLMAFQTKYFAWLTELSKEETESPALHSTLDTLVKEFSKLNNVYPEATLHNCIDGNDENRVVLGHTAIIGDKELDERIKNREENNT